MWVWHEDQLMLGERSETSGNQGVDYLQPVNYHLDSLGRPAVATDGYGHPVWRSNADPHGRDEGISLANTFSNAPFEETDISSNPITLSVAGTVSRRLSAF